MKVTKSIKFTGCIFKGRKISCGHYCAEKSPPNKAVKHRSASLHWIEFSSFFVVLLRKIFPQKSHLNSAVYRNVIAKFMYYIVKCKMKEYLLYRNKGFLVFNDGNIPESYWLTFQGQYHGGPSIVKEINKVEFEELISGELDIDVLISRYPERSGDGDMGYRIIRMYNLDKVLQLHELAKLPIGSQNFVSRVFSGTEVK